MGSRRDKSTFRLGGRTLLSRIRRTAERAGWPVRVIRRDLVPRCGPLGGVLTALNTSQAAAEIFLACDMPFITLPFLKRLARLLKQGSPAVFTGSADQAGFPFGIQVDALRAVRRQIECGEFSLQRLAKVLEARFVSAGPSLRPQFLNINTSEDWAEARRRYRAEKKARAGKRSKNPSGRRL
jgi:molybdopterin-guanine dinucleotide biosynthesis protein A